MITTIFRIHLLLGLLVLISSCTDNEYKSADFKSGDLIFQISTSSQSQAVQKATGSPYSHMGVIFENGGELYVYEAIQPVRPTPLYSWINRGQDGHFVVKRLKNADEALTPDKLKKMKAVGEQFAGKSYDIFFEWSDDRIYCSELVWKIFKQGLDIEIGSLQPLKTFRLDDPMVQKKMNERFGDSIPMDEPVISPKSMFDSDLLEEVYRN